MPEMENRRIFIITSPTPATFLHTWKTRRGDIQYLARIAYLGIVRWLREYRRCHCRTEAQRIRICDRPRDRGFNRMGKICGSDGKSIPNAETFRTVSL